MENWGGITFFESRLLFDPATNRGHRAARHLFHHRPRDGASMVRRSRHHGAGGTISGSTRASPPGWRAKAAEHFHPQWQSWLNGNGQKQFAMALDARRTSHPIQQPVANESEAMAAFDGITYNKGQALIRMLESYLGEDAFRAGIRTYMAAHAYGNTTTADLWRALERARPASRSPTIAAVLHRTGRRAADRRARPTCDGDEQRIRRCGRSRFSDRAGADRAALPPRNWQVPVAVGPLRAAQSADVRAAAGARPKSRPERCGEPIKVNLGDIGYYRVEYGAGEHAPRWRNRCRRCRRPTASISSPTAGRWCRPAAPSRHPISLWSRMIGVDDRRPVWDQIITAFSALNRLVARSARASGAAALRRAKAAPRVRPARLGRQRLGRRRRRAAARAA